MMTIGIASMVGVQGVKLGSYPDYTGPLKVSGEVNAYLSKVGNAYLTFTLNGLEDACKQTPEGVANACGIHIHEGKTCDDASGVGGHYYSTENDPWGVLGYNTGFGGSAFGSVKAAIGQGQDIAGRAIVVHDSTGGRVACALIPSELEVRDTLLEVLQCDTGCRDVCNQPFTAGGPDCCAACGCPRDDCPVPTIEVTQCDTGCRDVCNQPFTAGGPDCCAACGCPRGDCPAPVLEASQCDTGCRDVCNQPFTAGGPDCCAACGCPRDDCPVSTIEVTQCDTGCRDVCNQPFTAGGPDCCAACGCPRGDCPTHAIEV